MRRTRAAWRAVAYTGTANAMAVALTMAGAASGNSIDANEHREHPERVQMQREHQMLAVDHAAAVPEPVQHQRERRNQHKHRIAPEPWHSLRHISERCAQLGGLWSNRLRRWLQTRSGSPSQTNLPLSRRTIAPDEPMKLPFISRVIKLHWWCTSAQPANRLISSSETMLTVR